MAEHVEVVIKIPKYYLTHPQDYTCLAECVRRGVLLPKGHGRVIDESKITKCEQIGLIIKDGNVTRCLKTDAPTIIEAEKEEE